MFTPIFLFQGAGEHSVSQPPRRCDLTSEDVGKECVTSGLRQLIISVNVHPLLPPYWGERLTVLECFSIFPETKGALLDGAWGLGAPGGGWVFFFLPLAVGAVL